jgi:hypothetical protein
MERAIFVSGKGSIEPTASPIVLPPTAQATLVEYGGRIGRVRYKPQLAGLSATVDILAEYLSCGFEVHEAADKMALSRQAVDSVFRRIQTEIGWQAA